MVLRLLNPHGHVLALLALWRLIVARWELAVELTRRDLAERYAGQVFGLAWTVGHPLLQIIIYVIVFSRIFNGAYDFDPAHPLNQTTFLLAGLGPWMVMSEFLGKAPSLITANARMVKQVVFPIEVLPISAAMASMVTLIVGMVSIFIYGLIANGFLFWSILLLPFIMIMQFIMMIGIGYLLSAASPYFRDLKDFVSVYLSLALFISPVLYFKVNLPFIFQILIALNPFSMMIYVYQDVIWYGDCSHPFAWFLFFLYSLLFFSLGYRFFEQVKHGFADVL